MADGDGHATRRALGFYSIFLIGLLQASQTFVGLVNGHFNEVEARELLTLAAPRARKYP